MARAKCYNCLRPIKMCFCNDIIKQNNNTQLLIIQDPDEQAHYLNTAIMAKLSYKKCTLTTTDQLEEEILTSIIKESKYPAILYPELNNKVPQDHMGNIDLLIILDGTWRKAKRILSIFPILNELPSVGLSIQKPKRYELRKSKFQYQYSTFESITYALNSIERCEFDCSLELLDKQILKQKKFISHKKE